MTTLDLWVPIKPVAKQRPRMTRRGKAYTPQATHDFENAVRRAWWEAELPMLDGPVAVHGDWSTDGIQIKVMALDPERASKLRGDIDNYSKSLLDGLNGAAYGDDRKVMELWASKW